MALPPLEHQVKTADEIILATTVSFRNNLADYKVLDFLKPKNTSRTTDRLVNLFIGIFVQLGYIPATGQHVVLFFHKQEVFEMLPLDENDFIHYGGADHSVSKTLSIAQFRKMIS